MATKVDELVTIAKEAVEKRGMCVVIGLQSTGEASMQRQIDQSRLKDKFLSTCEDQLRMVIGRLDDFQHVRRSAKDIKALNDELDSMALPPSALDVIIDRLGGPTKVFDVVLSVWDWAARL